LDKERIILGMKIAMIASEAMPFAKTGGLADVAGALPKALRALGHEPILIMPLYRQVRKSKAKPRRLCDLSATIGDKKVSGGIWHAPIPGADVSAYFIEQDDYFDREGLYAKNGTDYPDNCERFAFFSQAALDALRKIAFAPDVVHVHDWQAALIPPYLKLLHSSDPVLGSAASLLTIHNIAYQGIFWHLDMPLLGLGWPHFNMHEFEFWGNINLLKGGIVYADEVNTVSPTYAHEIQTPAFGMGLDGVLHSRADRVHGIVNGIDDTVWDPAKDTHIAQRYSAEDLTGKAACKRALQRQAGLPQRKNAPVLGVISRLAEQKGLDLLARALPALLAEEEIQFIVLGDGDPEVRKRFELLASRFPKQCSLAARLDEKYAHRIMAGADMVVVPSRFEPCGLTQLYGLKYGTVPVARRTGGLADTIVGCTPETLSVGAANGFLFDNVTPQALAACVRRAIQVYRIPEDWRKLMTTGMAQDFSWSASAKRYVRLYKDAITKRSTP
jgi:starch synthase